MATYNASDLKGFTAPKSLDKDWYTGKCIKADPSDKGNGFMLVHRIIEGPIQQDGSTPEGVEVRNFLVTDLAKYRDKPRSYQFLASKFANALEAHQITVGPDGTFDTDDFLESTVELRIKPGVDDNGMPDNEVGSYRSVE